MAEFPGRFNSFEFEHRVRKFETEFLEKVIVFLEALPREASNKIKLNIKKAEYTNDPKLFKKLRDDIWEFRTNYKSNQIRIFAFWDKRRLNAAKVIGTHAIFKKSNRVPIEEIKKAVTIKNNYLKRTI